MSERLFVYGTLRRISKHTMARFLAERATFIGEATMPGRLYNLGRFPGMTEAEAAGETVVGDVYEMASDETLAELDRYEGAESPLPFFFERGSAEVMLTDGRRMQAMVYWFRGEVEQSQRIVSGDYGEILQGS